MTGQGAKAACIRILTSCSASVSAALLLFPGIFSMTAIIAQLLLPFFLLFTVKIFVLVLKSFHVPRMTIHPCITYILHKFAVILSLVRNTECELCQADSIDFLLQLVHVTGQQWRSQDFSTTGA